MWESGTGTGVTNFVVQQAGRYLHYFKLTNSNSSVSDKVSSFTTDLNSYKATGNTNTVALSPCQYANVNGQLIVVHPDCDPLYVEYDATGDTITETQIDIEVRDIEGLLDTTYDVEQRPGYANKGLLLTNDPDHYYNLLNAGWYTNSEGYLNEWDTARTDLPSRGDVWWHYESAGDPMDVSLIATTPVAGNREAPRGHYIQNYFRQNAARQTVVGAVSLPDTDQTTVRPTTVTGYSGRVWYSGTNSLGFNNEILFTQVIESPEQFGYCYQTNDPTAQDYFQLLASDGGVIVIPGLSKVVKLLTFREYLLVFATNGIWSIKGSTGSFAANDYVIDKISEIGTNAPNSIVIANEAPMWWTDQGILTINYNPDFGALSVVSVTNQSIASFYNGIPSENVQYVKSAYDPVTKVVHWLYNSSDGLTAADYYKYDSVLNLNTLTAAFYPWTFGSGTAYVQGIVTVKDPDGSWTPEVKYVTNKDKVAGTDFYSTYSDVSDTDYIDWDTEDDDVAYSSYFITGYYLHGESQRFFQPNYVYTFMEQETDGSCFVQGVYDFTNDGDTGKWSSKQQMYNSSLTMRDVNVRRLKIRGKGRALQLRFESEAGKPFTIYGWSIYETGNSSL